MSAPEAGIYILTGPVQSGKTTSLLQWAERRKDVHGILTPVMNGKRVFVDANSKEQFAMEAATGETATLPVGRFNFSKAGFDKAIQIIRNNIHKDGWLIIDEIGPLELRGEGFHDVLKEIFTLRRKKLILVVREDLAGKVAQQFSISQYAAVNNIRLLQG